MTAVDTNVLIYANDPRDPAKKAVAETLIQTITDGALMWPVCCEFLAVSRKLEPFGYGRAQAWSDVQQLRKTWLVILPRWDVAVRADDLIGRFSLSHWDSLLVAACLVGGVRRLYSEDITGYPRIDTLEIVNPF